MLRLLILVLSVLALVVTVRELADRHVTEPLPALVDPLDEARVLLSEGRLQEARWLTEFSLSHPDSGDSGDARGLLGQIDSADADDSAFASFLRGALSGEPDDMAGLFGALALDLLVIGDIRDLTVQGAREIRDGSGDELILALSAIGLASTVVPHVDWAPALLKSLRRGGALSPRFVRSARRTGASALRNGDFSALSKLLGDLAVATRHLGPRAFKRVVSGVDDGAGLARVAAASRRAPGSLYSVAVVAGKPGIRAVDATGSNIERVARAVRLASRGGKIGIKTVRIVPDRWLLLTAVAAALLLLAALPAVVRRRKRGSDDAVPILTEAVR